MKALFITMKDLKSHTFYDGSVDDNKIVQWVSVAQDTEIRTLLGSKLYNKLMSDITNNTLDGKYRELVVDYIKPALIHWSAVHSLPFLAYTVANGGIYKHTAESSESVDKKEVDFLIEKERNIAQNYSNILVDYLCYNSQDYPEYLTNSGNDIQPNREDNYFGGWVI
jgi:uncharacterized membrane protein